MTTLTVDRLHARYRTTRAVARDLATRVHPVLEGALATAMLDADGLPDVAHLCVPHLDVALEVDARAATAEIGRAWAEAVVASLTAEARAGRVVVYRRHVDALVDALVGITTRDLGRAFAWRQSGVVSASAPLTGVDDVVPALCVEPALLPATLRAVVSRGVVPAFSAPGWRTLAAAWDRHVGAQRPPSAATMPVGAVPAAVRRLVRAVPDEALDGPWSEEVARLVLVVLRTGEPPSRPVPTAGGTAVEALRDLRAGTVSSPVDEARDVDGPTAAPRDAGPTLEPTTTTAAEDEAVVSAWAGLFLLLGPFAALDLAGEVAAPSHPLHDLGPAATLALVAARLGDVGLDEPTVRTLSGHDPRGTDGRAVDPRDGHDAATVDEAVAALAERVAAHLRDRLDLAPDADLGWVWRRPGRIAWSPGWIEVTFDLGDVQVPLRRAGLDLDPGWSWWLGAVVRFRYA